MNEEWKSVAAQLSQLGLPILGRLLGGHIPIIGPLLGTSGGEMAGRIAASAIAKALGVEPTPEAVKSAIDNGETTEIVSTLRAIEGEAAVRWPALAQIEGHERTAEVEIAKINAETSAGIRKDMATNDPKASFYRTILMWVATANLAFIFGMFKYAYLFSPELFKLFVDGQVLLGIDVGISMTALGWHFTTRSAERKAAITMDDVNTLKSKGK